MIDTAQTIDPYKLEKAKLVPATELPEELDGLKKQEEPIKVVNKQNSKAKIILIVVAIIGGLGLITFGIVLILKNIP